MNNNYSSESTEPKGITMMTASPFAPNPGSPRSSSFYTKYLLDLTRSFVLAATFLTRTSGSPPPDPCMDHNRQQQQNRNEQLYEHRSADPAWRQQWIHRSGSRCRGQNPTRHSHRRIVYLYLNSYLYFNKSVGLYRPKDFLAKRGN